MRTHTDAPRPAAALALGREAQQLYAGALVLPMRPVHPAESGSRAGGKPVAARTGHTRARTQHRAPTNTAGEGEQYAFAETCGRRLKVERVCGCGCAKDAHPFERRSGVCSCAS
eukprot:scaffold6283_cov127-Isochrysis_galbana.AAC.3